MVEVDVNPNALVMPEHRDSVHKITRRAWLRGCGAMLALGSLGGCAASQMVSPRSNALTRLSMVLERGELVAGVMPDYAPQSSIDPDRGAWIGFDVEVLKCLAQGLGVRIRFEHRRWTAMYPALEDGTLDVVMQSIVTAERMSQVAFLNPVIHGVHFVTLAHARDERDLLGWDDLDGLRVGVGEGFAAEKLVAEHPRIRAVSYANTIDALRDVVAHKIDAVIEDNLLANYYMKTVRLPIRIAAPLTAPKQIAFSVRRDEPALREWLNTAIWEFVGSDAYLKISKKWFGIDPSKPTIGY